MYPKHDKDFYGWALATADLLKQGKYQEADMDYIIEEIEDMGRSEKRQLVNRLAVLFAHLMKWTYQPELREENARGWEATIEHQRHKIKRLIQENPSLKPQIPDVMAESFLDSKMLLKKETLIDLKRVPQNCPYHFEQIIADDFYPNFS